MRVDSPKLHIQRPARISPFVRLCHRSIEVVDELQDPIPHSLATDGGRQYEPVPEADVLQAHVTRPLPPGADELHTVGAVTGNQLCARLPRVFTEGDIPGNIKVVLMLDVADGELLDESQ